jgi:hypothetical protein
MNSVFVRSGHPGGQKSLGLDAPMGPRKSISKFLELSSRVGRVFLPALLFAIFEGAPTIIC